MLQRALPTFTALPRVLRSPIRHTFTVLAVSCVFVDMAVGARRKENPLLPTQKSKSCPPPAKRNDTGRLRRLVSTPAPILTVAGWPHSLYIAPPGGRAKRRKGQPPLQTLRESNPRPVEELSAPKTTRFALDHLAHHLIGENQSQNIRVIRVPRGI
jgi:hypothetical protein